MRGGHFGFPHDRTAPQHNTLQATWCDSLPAHVHAKLRGVGALRLSSVDVYDRAHVLTLSVCAFPRINASRPPETSPARSQLRLRRLKVPPLARSASKLPSLYAGMQEFDVFLLPCCSRALLAFTCVCVHLAAVARLLPRPRTLAVAWEAAPPASCDSTRTTRQASRSAQPPCW